MEHGWHMLSGRLLEYSSRAQGQCWVSPPLMYLPVYQQDGLGPVLPAGKPRLATLVYCCLDDDPAQFWLDCSTMHQVKGEGRRVTVCFAKIDQKLIPWAAQQGKNKYDKYLESLPLWRRLKNNYHNWTAMFVFSCLNMSKGQLIWNEHFINTANIEVCTWGAGKLYFCFFLYCTARQQTFPESQLLEAWPASIYGHLRDPVSTSINATAVS